VYDRSMTRRATRRQVQRTLQTISPEPTGSHTGESTGTMSGAQGQQNADSQASNQGAGPATRLTGAALDEALRRARQNYQEQAKRKFIEEAETGGNPIWDPSWDSPEGHQTAAKKARVEALSKTVKLGNLTKFGGKKYSDFTRFINDLKDRFALTDELTEPDKVRIAASYLQDTYLQRWRNHLTVAHQGDTDSIDNFRVFEEWLRKIVATPAERRTKGVQELIDIQQREGESYDTYSDRFDAIITEYPDELPETTWVTFKIRKMRAELRERTQTLGEPETLDNLATLARKAESFNKPIGTGATPAGPQSASTTQPADASRNNLAHPSKASFGAIRQDLSQVECWNCHATGHYATSCPKAICDKCGQTGHITSRCTEGSPVVYPKTTPATAANQNPIGRRERK